MTHSMHKSFITHTILQLYTCDVVAADASFMEHIQESSYLHSNECACAENLITAAKNNDEGALATAIKGIGRAFLDNNIVKICKRLTIEGINGDFLDYDQDEDDDAVAMPTPSKPTSRPPRTTCKCSCKVEVSS